MAEATEKHSSCQLVPEESRWSGSCPPKQMMILREVEEIHLPVLFIWFGKIKIFLQKTLAHKNGNDVPRNPIPSETMKS